jgi:hypothetical protein
MDAIIVDESKRCSNALVLHPATARAMNSCLEHSQGQVGKVANILDATMKLRKATMPA